MNVAVESAEATRVDVAAKAGSKVVYAAVVPEAATTPESSVVANAKVAEAVIDTAIVANKRTPIAGVPEEAAAVARAPTSRVSKGRLRRVEQPMRRQPSSNRSPGCPMPNTLESRCNRRPELAADRTQGSAVARRNSLQLRPPGPKHYAR